MNPTERPRLSPEVRFADIGGEGVLLISESWGTFPLSGSLWPRLLPLLDGEQTVRELAIRFGNPTDVFECYRALFLLKKRGLLEDGPAPSDPARLFWKAVEGGERRVRIERVGGPRLEALEQILAMSEIAVDSSAHVSVVLTDDYRRAALGEINQGHLRDGHPWLLMRCEGWRTWIGPVFTPGQGPCWECLASRLRVNQSEVEFVEGLESGPPGKVADGPHLLSTAATRMLVSIAAPLIERVCLTGNAGALANAIWTIDLNTMEQATHHVVQRPQCPACGNPALAGGSSDFRLRAPEATTGSAAEGRTASPWLTYERFRHHISPISGVVPEISPGLLDENPFHLFASGTNRATPIRNTGELLSFSLRSKSGGKGASRENAVAGALAEGLERYSCSWRGDGGAIRARMSELGEEAIDPRTILAFSDTQYANRERINARGERYNRVPEMFDPERIIQWTSVRSLMREVRRFVPTALCWFGYPADFACADSNGCAAGNNLEEAILQGACELIERDSVAIWWYNQIPRPEIDLSSLRDSWCGSMVEMLRTRYGRRTVAIDLTTDIGIPVAAAVSYLPDEEHPEFFFGLGAHPDPHIAVRRAFTEMCQFFGGLRAWAGDETVSFARHYRNMDPGMARWLETATRANQPQMIPSGRLQQIQNHPRREGVGLMEDIENVMERLRSAGLEAFALDCTQPDIGMPVARVFVPGLRHFWARFAPGRLYSVPVKLGWLPHEKRECDLNPMAMFF